MQQVAGSGHAAANGAQRAAQPGSGLLVRQALPVTQQNDRPQPIGQLFHLRLQQVTEIEMFCAITSFIRGCGDSQTALPLCRAAASGLPHVRVERPGWPRQTASFQATRGAGSTSIFAPEPGTSPGTRHARRPVPGPAHCGRLRMTIGPCRSTSTSKAASADESRPAAKRSSNCRSDRPAGSPSVKQRAACRVRTQPVHPGPCAVPLADAFSLTVSLVTKTKMPALWQYRAGTRSC